jgi:hypothetical protein
MNRTLLSSLALAIALAAAPAQARTSASTSGGGVSTRSTGNTTLSLALDLDPWPGGAGFGFRVGLPLAPQGILHAKVRDELVLEVGGDYLHYSDRVGYGPYAVDYSWNGLLAVAGLQWNFWLVPQLALYPKIDLGFETGWYTGWDPQPGYYYDRHGYGGLFAQVAAGAIYRLQSVDLRLELGSAMVRLVVGFRI